MLVLSVGSSPTSIELKLKLCSERTAVKAASWSGNLMSRGSTHFPYTREKRKFSFLSIENTFWILQNTLRIPSEKHFVYFWQSPPQKPPLNEKTHDNRTSRK